MKTNTISIALLLALTPTFTACSDSHANGRAANEATKTPVAAPPATDELAETPARLLDLAFDAASALPTQPHAKTRARLQESVATTALALGAPQRAETYAARIEGWRRGSAYADIAFERAKKGDATEAQRVLELATTISTRPLGENEQEWPRDRIRAKLAQTHLWLGHDEEATKLETGLEPAEMGKSASVRAMRTDAPAFDEEVAALDKMVAASSFDTLRQILEGYAQLYARFYADVAKRELVESKIDAAWKKLPLDVRIELVSELAEAALAHDDRATALAHVERGHAFLGEATWAPEDRLPLVARLAALRHRAGETAKARTELDTALTDFDAARTKIDDINRADALRPIAEAYQAMGDANKALVTYARALEESVANPNSRPRVEDLTAMCCSMAKNAVEPTPELWKRLTEVRASLRDPW